MRTFLLLLCSVVLLMSRVTAQNHTITGTVTDAEGAPIAGASITIKGSNRGTSTGNDGSFTITVSGKDKTMNISAVNFATLEVGIAGKTTIGTISLQPGNKSLDEVVVVAYGTQKKTNITGAVVTVNGAQVADKPHASVDKALQGSVAGLQSSSSNGIPGSSTDVLIRGVGSINAGTNPLWVIDGVIASTGDFTVNTTSANALSGLNPDDIESMSVLKDASATALYGNRAANGVIIVTTKKGKAGKTRINFSTEVGANSIAYNNKHNKPMNTAQYHGFLQQALLNDTSKHLASAAEADDYIINSLGFPADWTSTNTNWQKVVTRTGNQQQYNLSLSGGNEKTQYFASAGYFDQDGTTLATSFKRYNGNLNVTTKVNDKITFNAAINGSFSNQESPIGSSGYSNPVASSFFLPPWYSPYNADGSLRYLDPEGEFPLVSQFNPLVIAAWNKYQDQQLQFRGYVSGEYQILNNLKFTSRYSGEFLDFNEFSYWNPIYGDGDQAGGIGQAYDRRIYDWTWTNQIDYHANFNAQKDFYMDLLVGTEAYAFNNYYLQAAGESYPQTTSLIYLASAASPLTAYNLPTSYSTNSYFSRATFNYKDRYILSGSFRRDGSSVFAQDHKWGNFGSVGASWNINEEDFMKALPVFSLLKLRSSWGVTGNTNGFGLYDALPTYGYGFPYEGNAGSAPTNVGNQLLTWERNKAFNVGLDWGLWKDRLSGTVEYYNRVTSDLLVNVPLSLTSGFTSQLSNAGSLYNRGIEVTLNGKPIVTRDFSWTASINFSHNKNRVTSLYNHAPIAPSGSRYNITEGHDIHEVYTRLWAGVNPDNGDPQFYTDATRKTITNNGANATLSLTGKSASPQYFGGFTNTFTYKAFSLSAQLYYNLGNYVYDQWAPLTMSDGQRLPGTNQLTGELNYWKAPGDKTNVPRPIYGGNNSSNNASTRFLYKGNYYRLRDVNLSYTLPKSVLNSAKINNLTFYVRGTNLLTFGTDKGLSIDPELGANSLGDLQVFMPKTISGGIKLGF